MHDFAALRSTTSRRQWLALALVAAVAACGGGSDPPAVEAAAPPPPPPAPAPLPSLAQPVDLDDNHQVGVSNWPSGNTASGGQGQPVMNIPCGADDLRFHIHSHLSIFVNGVALSVPDHIGFVETPTLDCKYRLHTHDLSGKIHIEGPFPQTHTLGELFAIWGQPLARDNVAGITGLPVDAFVVDNAVVSRHDGELSAIELKSHRHIAIQLGTPVTQLPFFTWSAN